MKNNFDSIDEYYISTYDKVLKLTPVIGGSAALTFTIARLFGEFSFASIPQLICFDVACLSYFIIAFILRRRGIVKNGVVNASAKEQGSWVLSAIIVFQWNLITYIFPTRTFWGYAPMFIMLSAFMFQSKSVRNTTVGIAVSIAISWLIKPEELLPQKDDYFIENFTLRIVALLVSFFVIYMLTFYAEKFTFMVKDNIKSIENQNKELESMGRDIIDFTADIIEERDTTSGLHVKRLKKSVEILATELAKNCPEYNLTEERISLIVLASALHDVGKIAISDNILNKPGRLTPEEFEEIKTHTTIGARIIDKLPDSAGSDFKRYCREICLFHHEKYDGKGYPIGLKGEEIPISAQIVSMVDCYDALISERPYKSALPSSVAINMILNGECGCFSEKMKKCLTSCSEQFGEIY